MANKTMFELSWNFLLNTNLRSVGEHSSSRNTGSSPSDANLDPGKISVASNTCEWVQKDPRPTAQTELRSFLGLCNDYFRVIASLDIIAAYINKHLAKDILKSFELTEEQLES